MPHMQRDECTISMDVPELEGMIAHALWCEDNEFYFIVLVG